MHKNNIWKVFTLHHSYVHEEKAQVQYQKEEGTKYMYE